MDEIALEAGALDVRETEKEYEVLTARGFRKR